MKGGEKERRKIREGKSTRDFVCKNRVRKGENNNKENNKWCLSNCLTLDIGSMERTYEFAVVASRGDSERWRF